MATSLWAICITALLCGLQSSSIFTTVLATEEGKLINLGRGISHSLLFESSVTRFRAFAVGPFQIVSRSYRFIGNPESSPKQSISARVMIMKIWRNCRVLISLLTSRVISLLTCALTVVSIDIFIAVFFDYTSGPNGPAHWGDFPGWETCKTGMMQSPIAVTPDLMVTDNDLDSELDTHYPEHPIPATISNDGHTVEVLNIDVVFSS